MSTSKVSSRASDVFAATIRARKTKGKEPDSVNLTYYLPLTREIREALGGVEEGEVLTLGVLKRVKPLK